MQYKQDMYIIQESFNSNDNIISFVCSASVTPIMNYEFLLRVATMFKLSLIWQRQNYLLDLNY